MGSFLKNRSLSLAGEGSLESVEWSLAGESCGRKQPMELDVRWSSSGSADEAPLSDPEHRASDGMLGLWNRGK